ncbi:uncharacterized protein LOC128276870 [Anopheles cruzii]|uniref:uncharacterized protein LOC128276870 n=1 Tax=Anopheles cruzii TaxID=68878 RepID=UPI0022EC2778|nr:uncharacterized protein LOC128276870 [Anopheles cruzii]
MSFADPWVKQDRQHNISDSLSGTTTANDEATTYAATERQTDSTSRSASLASLEFEDNFDPKLNPRQPQDNRLPDSDNYLAVLEKRLDRLKHSSSVLQQLSERREACMRSLLSDSTTLRGELLELEEPVNNSELLRFIRPVQALSQAEIVRLVHHDQLQKEEHEESREGEESGTESSTSR